MLGRILHKLNDRCMQARKKKGELKKADTYGTKIVLRLDAVEHADPRQGTIVPIDWPRSISPLASRDKTLRRQKKVQV